MHNTKCEPSRELWTLDDDDVCVDVAVQVEVLAARSCLTIVTQWNVAP